MIIDCDACAVRDLACGDCVVTVLLGTPAAQVPSPVRHPVDLDGREQAAIAVLAESGLVPPLRLVARDGDGLGDAGDAGTLVPPDAQLPLPPDAAQPGPADARRRAAG
jgi:hypothetical protein